MSASLPKKLSLAWASGPHPVLPGVLCGEDFLPRSSAAASNKLLYRRWGLAVILALLVVAITLPGFAQMPQLKRPNEEPEERPPAPKKVKKVKGPRAVALLQTTSKGKTTLVPVAILVEGKFYDASEYKADPVPMALESGTIYEVERSGSSEGLFTINRALHYKSPNSLHPWVGDGSFLANGSEAAKTAHKAENVPRGFDNTADAPPRLTRPAAASSPSSGPAVNPAGSDKNASPAPSSDKSSPGSAGSSAAPTTPSPSESSQKASAAPSSGSTQGSKQSTASTSPSSTQQEQSQAPAAKQGDQSQENYYRPTLRRGKPTSQAPTEEEDELEPSKADLKTGAPGSKDNASAATASPPQLVPAISDGGGPDPRSYEFFWKTGEEDDRRSQMQALAATEVKAYVAALEKNRIAAKPASGTKPAAHKPAAKPAQPELEDVHFQGFDVWLNNQPVMVFTANAHIPAVAGSDIPPETYNITLVARTDIYGDLRKLYSGVTDRFHLDVTPKLELIDVVDADGDGRGELLFSETTDVGTGYIIYRATADKLWKLFDSLGGGA